ncbi:hypothetical protein ACFWBC_13800 [Streptomyces sp. NPDC059985]|uniref:hypothetical protein n=1 Tax=Streptomyces sp. NPDC059985 TaxID=3347025 RepID=UPI0036C9581D
MATINSGNYAEELEAISASLDRLVKDANAVAVVLVDQSGQPVGAAGAPDLMDNLALPSLTDKAADVAANLTAGNDFSALLDETEKQHIQITAVTKRALLLVIYKEGDTSLGLVRTRARKTNTELTKSIQTILDKTPAQETAPLPELTEEAIETLFSE